MNNKSKLHLAIVLSVLLLVVTILLSTPDTTTFVSESGCCTVQIKTLDNNMCEIYLYDSTIMAGDSDIYSLNDVDTILGNVKDYCIAHH